MIKSKNKTHHVHPSLHIHIVLYMGLNPYHLTLDLLDFMHLFHMELPDGAVILSLLPKPIYFVINCLCCLFVILVEPAVAGLELF
jgi:hypothetical protein